MSDTLEGMRFAALEERLAAAGVNPVHAKALFNAVQRKLIQGPLADVDSLLPPLQRWLATEDAPPRCPIEVVDQTPSADGFTHKYLLQLGDGAEV